MGGGGEVVQRERVATAHSPHGRAERQRIPYQGEQLGLYPLGRGGASRLRGVLRRRRPYGRVVRVLTFTGELCS